MDTPEASYPQLQHVAASLGVSMSSQAAPYSDGNLRQVAGLSDHALAHAYQVLAGTQSQHGQSTASDAVDGSGTGLGRGRSDPVGADGAMYLAHHGLWL